MKPEDVDVRRGTQRLVEHLEKIIDDNQEISDLHEAFEYFCMNKYSIGDRSIRVKAGGKHDCGIDFYSINNAAYHVAQCKIPVRNWLESHPEKPKKFGQQAVNDVRDALGFLLTEKKITANEEVRYLFGQVQNDMSREDFSLVFFLLVFGYLNERARKAFNDLRDQYAGNGIRIVLQEIKDIVDDFLVGSSRTSGKVDLALRTDKGNILSAHNYCYFLANARDVFDCFQKYGWRLFDLNLRYEIRNSSVNGDIVNSLKRHGGRKYFHHYNNGLIIVCTSYEVRDDRVRIYNGQIVNGLQTVKSIYNAVTTKEVRLEELDSECRVQVKVISMSRDQKGFVAGVVRATNNQNPMAPRNLRSNEREQKIIRTEFASLQPRWFYQVKQGEWDSLTEEGARFFKAIIGYPPAEFRPSPGRKRGRVIDNQDSAKAWLAFIGFSDWAGDRTTHYFSKPEVYDIAFCSRPSETHWKLFSNTTDFHDDRRLENLEKGQASAWQYFLAYVTWRFTRRFIPAPRHYRVEALDEGVRQGKIRKADGSIKSTDKEQEDFLAESPTYQTWRLMANMKEILVEAVAYVLAMKYGPLTEEIAKSIVKSFDASGFVETGDIRDIAQRARESTDLPEADLFSRVLRFLQFASQQFWEDKRNRFAATSRLRTLLLRPEMARDFKEKILELDKRKGIDKPWKPAGRSFVESLPPIPNRPS